MLVGCFFALCSDSCIHSVAFKTHFLFLTPQHLIVITTKLFLIVPQFAFSPFLFFSWPSTIHYSDATKMENRRTQGHISSIAVPKHISSLKHLDIFVIEHFFPSLSWCYMLVNPSACARERFKVCVCLCLCTCLIPFVRECDVQSSKLKQRGDWAIDGSINWYTVLVMSSVRRCMSLFYGLHL